MAKFRYSLTAPDVLTGVIYLLEHNLDNDTAYFIDVYTDAEEAQKEVDTLNGK